MKNRNCQISKMEIEFVIQKNVFFICLSFRMEICGICYCFPIIRIADGNLVQMYEKIRLTVYRPNHVFE